jgi:hypothetical protein
MAKVPVNNYRVEWNPVNNNGVIYTQIGNGPFEEAPINSTEEFIAVMLMMSKSPVLFDTQTKDLECGPRPVGT